MTLVPGPWSAVASSPEESLARVLADPDGVRSVHRPIVDLAGRDCCGWVAGVRLAGSVGQDAAPWFRAAARTGHGDRLAEVALAACLRGRATLPGRRSLVVPVGTRAIGADVVLDLLDAEDDVSDLVVLLENDPEGPRSPRSPRELHARAADRLAGLRVRGLRVAAGAGQAGVLDLAAMRTWTPDVWWLGADLVRDIDTDGVRQRLLALVVGLAAESGGAVVVADAVESPGEVRALRDLGVDWASGWLIGRSRSGFMPPSVELAALLPSASPAPALPAARAAAALIPAPAGAPDEVDLNDHSPDHFPDPDLLR